MAICCYFQCEWVFSEVGPALTRNIQKSFCVLKCKKTLVRNTW